jgi:hypothetical protein
VLIFNSPVQNIRSNRRLSQQNRPTCNDPRGPAVSLYKNVPGADNGPGSFVRLGGLDLENLTSLVHATKFFGIGVLGIEAMHGNFRRLPKCLSR